MLKRRAFDVLRRCADGYVLILGPGGRRSWARSSHGRLAQVTLSPQNRLRVAALPSPRAHRTGVRNGPGSFAYISDPWDQLNAASLADFAGWEPITRRFFGCAARGSRNVVDVGAYTGVFSLIAASIEPGTHVWAFEPFPKTFERLTRNIDVNAWSDRITAHPFALGAESGERTMSMPSGDSSMAQITEGCGTPVRQVTLDSVVDGSLVDLIKIDAEGSELGVLAGARETLARGRPVVITEALDERQRTEQFNALRGFGYTEGIQLGRSGGDERNFVWFTNDRAAAVHDCLSAAVHSHE